MTKCEKQREHRRACHALHRLSLEECKLLFAQPTVEELRGDRWNDRAQTVEP